MDITEEDKNRIEQDAEAHSNSFQPNENIYGAFDIQQLRLYAKKDYIKGAIHELELLAEEREIAKNAYLAISQREQLKNGIIQELEQKNKELREALKNSSKTKEGESCPNCLSDDVIMFTSDLDLCRKCGQTF